MNQEYIKDIINSHYKKEETKEKHITALTESEAKRYDTVLTLAKGIGKGWYATLLASKADCRAILPPYILKAIVFASQSIINDNIIWKMLCYSIDGYPDEETKEIKEKVKNACDSEGKITIINDFIKNYPDDMFSQFMLSRRELLNE